MTKDEMIAIIKIKNALSVQQKNRIHCVNYFGLTYRLLLLLNHDHDQFPGQLKQKVETGKTVKTREIVEGGRQ